MKLENVLGALIAVIVSVATATMALLQQPEVMSLADVSGAAWAVLALGAVVTFGKDLQALATRRLLRRKKKFE